MTFEILSFLTAKLGRDAAGECGWKASFTLNQPLPRFSIWHIFLWSAICALLLNSTNREALASDKVFYVLEAFCNSGAIFVAILLLARLAKQAKPEPGYWLAIASLLDGFSLPQDVIFTSSYGFGETPKLIFILAFTCCAVQLCGWNWYWRLAIVFVGGHLVVSNFFITLSQFFPFTTVGGIGWGNPLVRAIHVTFEYSAVAFTLLAIAIDLNRKRYRDWLHWIGLLYCVMHWAHMVQNYLLPLLFPDIPPIDGENPFGDVLTLPGESVLVDPFNVP